MIFSGIINAVGSVASTFMEGQVAKSKAKANVMVAEAEAKAKLCELLQRMMLNGKC